MDRIAEFQKVSFDQFAKDYGKDEGLDKIKNIYDSIKIPERATEHSAGYDFYVPENIIVKPGKTCKFPTGIRCKIEEDYVLLMFIRSSIGFKYNVVLSNGTGVIDSDYYNADNEGHMFVSVINSGNKELVLNAGDRICQGVFVRYGITVNDNSSAKRIGGIGSTDRGNLSE